jgi:hypothetical protein
MRCKLSASGLPFKNVSNHLKMQGLMDATADDSECPCDNLPHGELFTEQSGPPAPDFDGGLRPGDDLYTDCVLALDPDAGKLKWYFNLRRDGNSCACRCELSEPAAEAARVKQIATVIHRFGRGPLDLPVDPWTERFRNWLSHWAC